MIRDYKHNCGIYVLGAIGTLREMKFIEGGIALSPKGVAEYDQLRQSGFRPCKKDIEGMLVTLMTPSSEEDLRGVVVMIENLDKFQSEAEKQEGSPVKNKPPIWPWQYEWDAWEVVGIVTWLLLMIGGVVFWVRAAMWLWGRS